MASARSSASPASAKEMPGNFASRRGNSVSATDASTFSGTTTSRHLGPDKDVGEFCFVPHSADAAEDSGVLMSYVHDRARGLSDLVLLDAETLEDVATVHLPARVPAGFHGNWAPTST